MPTGYYLFEPLLAAHAELLKGGMPDFRDPCDRRHP
jgi:hypothetical protein